jgi:hypothetical protein
MKFFCFVSFFSIGSFFLITGCSNQENPKVTSSGKSGEIIVVMDSTLWKSLPGKILQDSLMVAFPGIPQQEATFKLIHVQKSDFKNILQFHRNVLMVDIGPLPGERNFLLSYKNDLWAMPQLVMSLRAKSVVELESALLSVIPTIVSRFNSVEENRMVQDLRNSKELQITRDLKKAIGVTMPFTEDFFIAKQEPNYVWIRKETIHISMGFQFTRIPYTSDSLFSLTSLTTLRDSISKKNIPGPSEGSYMVTDHEYTLISNTITIDSSYAVEAMGLWRTQGDFMGGPFRTFLVHDKAKNELIFIDAFVYAPKFNKREYVKQMTAMVKSLKIG